MATVIRVKIGLGIYDQEFKCSRCGKTFVNRKQPKSIFLRLHEISTDVDIIIAICEECVEKVGLFEGLVSFAESQVSYPIGVA